MPQVEFCDELRYLLSAGNQALFTETIDTQRLLGDIAKAAAATTKKRQYTTIVWDVSQGFAVWAEASAAHNPLTGTCRAPYEALEAIERYTHTPRTVFVLLNFHQHLDSPLVRGVLDRLLRTRALATVTDDDSRTPIDRVLYFVQPPCAGGLHPEIAHMVMPLAYTLPGPDQLREVVDHIANSCSASRQPNGEQREGLVQALRGLGSAQAEDVLAYCSVRLDGMADTLALTNAIKEKKALLLGRGGALQYIPDEQIPARSELAGMDAEMAYVALQAQAYLPEALAHKLDPPRGIVLLGMPGAGKTQFAKACARIIQDVTQRPFPLFWINVGALFDSLVGASEARLEELLATLDAQGGCVAMFDEMEKMVGQASSANDSGVTQRLLGRLLQWMSERTQITGEQNSQVYLVVTMNRVTGVPPEFFRRFDRTFFFDLPNAAARRAILEIHLRKRDIQLTLTDAEWDELINLTKDFVGSELEDVVMLAHKQAFAHRQTMAGRVEVTHAWLAQAAKQRKSGIIASLQSEELAAIRELSHKLALVDDTAARPVSNTRQPRNVRVGNN